ncbi:MULTISPECIES: DUF4330 domain-containing protein [unclassified Nostoc]|uniref:DUF4330 domain-containing protein n=1 Tax=unclassified Nostoc TaxID=2593658 RepID=UPI002AD23063|nr:DUF4330 domain-containing protein [Nostoc sp. DedQUE03]MDZ7975336.1 DUF4330 domain-containing protein [Nostoc sp. DedQUE03]MDZ8045175.1 DUF4330 domain-containing protein [Nostoc sp. DedQUE02]
MAILDSKGRLFGKINLLDLGAALVTLVVIFVILSTFLSSLGLAQIGEKIVPIEVDLVVRGLNVRDPEQLFNSGLKKGGKTSVIIRNQPYGGPIEIKSVQQLPRTVNVFQPDGTVKELPDPKTNNFSTDMLLTLEGKAKSTESGPVLGSSKVKIGMPFELEGYNYNFNATVIDIRLKDK